MRFFEAVKVNDNDQAIRQNRLVLLAMINQAMLDFADFRVIEG
jgi:glycyl-tRNA synthetase beta subunit